MRISTWFRHLREGCKNVIRNGWMTFASVSSISISLFILGVFLLLSLNVDYLAKQIESQVEIRVFLELNTPQEKTTEIQQNIGNISQVSKVTFVSKEEGMQFLREKLGDDGKDLLEGFDGENNPLNDSFTVEVNEPRNVAAVAQSIQQLNNGQNPPVIYKVMYGQGTVETLFKVTSIVRYVVIVLVLCLALTAMFLIANTIKLTILARRREIAIMKLVGATNNFIRWPFFIEGMILGVIGSLVPIGIILFGYFKLVNLSQFEFGLMMIQLKPFNEISTAIGGLLLGIGVVIGVWGSTISVRKFLKV